MAGPNGLVAPVGRRCRRRCIRRARRVWIAPRQLDLARRIARGIDHRQIIATLFQRSVDWAVGVDGRVALVARNLVVHVDLGIRPVPHGDDDVALPALRTCRCGGGQFARGDAVSPVRVHRQSALPANLREARAHAAARHAFRNRTCGETAELMTTSAAVGVHDLTDPLTLALDVRGDAVALIAGAWEIGLRRHLEQREPVLSGIECRRRFLVGRRDRLQVDNLARRGLDLRGVDEPVAADPHVVFSVREVGYQIASLVVSHDTLDQTGRRAPGFRNDPDPGFRSPGASHQSGDVVVVDGDRAGTGLPDHNRTTGNEKEHGDAPHQNQCDGQGLLRPHCRHLFPERRSATSIALLPSFIEPDRERKRIPLAIELLGAIIP